MNRRVTTPLALALLLLAPACSVRKLALGGVSAALSDSWRTFATEDDPELVRESMPFALKAIEAVLLESPDNEKLLLAASAGFGLYSYAFVELDAAKIEYDDYRAAEALRARARALYLRARDYALHALELRHPGIRERLLTDPHEAAGQLLLHDVDAAYLTGGAWGLAIALGKDDPALVADLDAVRALLRRALELDEDYQEGALHEAMISIEGLPEAMGGSPERARAHFERALKFSGGRRASLYLSLAENVAVPAQDRVEFEDLMHRALEVDLDADPEQRLSNRISQERARRRLAEIDDIFLPPLDE